MALVKLNALVDNVSGSVGNLVFSRTKGGLSVRSRRTVPYILPDVFHQWASFLTQCTVVYKTLNPAEIASWTAAAKLDPYQNRLGDTRVMSGWAYFAHLNTWRRQCFQPINRLPPLIPPLKPITNLKYSDLTPLDMTITYDGPVGNELYYYYLHYGAVYSSAVNYVNDWRFLDFGIVTNNVENTNNLNAVWNLVQPQRFVGQKIPLKITLIHVDSGKRLHPLRLDGIVSGL